LIRLAKPFGGEFRSCHSWQEGDAVVAVDGQPVTDLLDFYFYAPAGEQMVLSVQRRSGEKLDISLPPEALPAVTACFAPLEFKRCACKCVFCFVDQNPPGMRPEIYVKDEDFRLSFLFGNYVTLTGLGRRGLARVIQQRLSPLFVSVHATREEVRARMLGRKSPTDLLPTLRELATAGIRLHTQVVLCPGWNDGPILTETIRDLLALAPGVASLAIVPVGLTDFRQGLTPLQPVTPEIARQVIDQVAGFQVRVRDESGRTFVHLSDEFYLLAEAPLPSPDSYDDFPQVDNGIGLTVRLAHQWREELQALREAGGGSLAQVTLLTGEAAALAFQREVLPVLAPVGPVPVEVIGVANRFFGPRVTVAGLLAGADVRRALQDLPATPSRTVFLPERMFNNDGLTVDGLDLDTLRTGLPHRVLVPPEEGLVDFWGGLD